MNDSYATNTDEVIALGKTAKEWVDLLHGDKACKAKRALNFFDGQQEQEMIKLLNSPGMGRKSWKDRGFAPRFRNLTSAIVEKSGLLFKDNPPVFSVYRDGASEPDPTLTEMFMTELDKVEYIEMFSNFDQVVRLLKTSILLIQYDTDEEKLVFDILHRGNCQVIIDPATRGIGGLIYCTDEGNDESNEEYYRIITKEEYIDICAYKNGTHKPVVENRQPNTFGIVPACQFYDTKTPRNGFWVEASHDLISLNEMYNLHLSDTEFSMKWHKLPTLMLIDCEVDGDGEQRVEEQVVWGQKLPMQMPTSPEVSGGPGKAIQLKSTGNGSPSVSYVGPNAQLQPMDQIFENWVKQFAHDWSVRVEVGGEARATSGFQIVVEELPNLELRKARQRMFESGFKRMWRIIVRVLNIASPITMSEDTELFVEFDDPILPVEAKEQEDLWTVRIQEGRATEIDYFMTEQGLSKEEAEVKYMEVIEFNARKEALAIIAKQNAMKEFGLQDTTANSSKTEPDTNPNNDVPSVEDEEQHTEQQIVSGQPITMYVPNSVMQSGEF